MGTSLKHGSGIFQEDFHIAKSSVHGSLSHQGEDGTSNFVTNGFDSCVEEVFKGFSLSPGGSWDNGEAVWLEGSGGGEACDLRVQWIARGRSV